MALFNPESGEEKANQAGVATMMMKCEGFGSVLSRGKCAANGIAPLNQICSAWVIECCCEKRARLYVGTEEVSWSEWIRRRATVSLIHGVKAEEDKFITALRYCRRRPWLKETWSQGEACSLLLSNVPHGLWYCYCHCLSIWHCFESHTFPCLCCCVFNIGSFCFCCSLRQWNLWRFQCCGGSSAHAS